MPQEENSHKKNMREVITYVIFGGLTTLINMGVFALFNELGVNVLIGNMVAWVVAILFAYITNKLVVFRAKQDTRKALAQEFVSFIVVRLLTLGIEQLGLWIFVENLHFNDYVIKIILTVIVIIANYIFSKFIIFKKA